MLSKQTEEHIALLFSAQPTYKPNQTVLAKLQKTTLVCFVGAAGMGKTTVMDTLVSIDGKRFGKTRNFTTRPPRPDDDTERYYYFDHTDEGLRPIFARIESRELLQYNIDPFSHYIYGSEIDGYTHPYNVADIWSTSIDGFRQLGFGRLYICSVVTDPDEWLTRFNERFGAANPLRQARLKEAVVSLEWSLAQSSDDHCFIIDRDGKADEAADTVQRFLAGEHIDQTEARHLALDCLEKAKEEL